MILPISVYTEHDYFSAYTIWFEKPTVCLVDIPLEDLYITYRAANQWREAMQNYTQLGTFFYDIKIPNVTVPINILKECNITINQVETLPVNAQGGTPIGVTDCKITTEFCTIKIRADYMKGAYYHDTVVHELGHALGLHHRLPYQLEGMGGVLVSNDIMMPVAKSHLIITKASLDAIIWFHSGTNYLMNYTIPHNDTWEDQVDWLPNHYYVYVR